MKKQQLDHVLRAAGRITGERQFIIIGSQSLHGTYPDLVDELAFSAEADLIARADLVSKRGIGRTEWLNAIGQDSPFHNEFGYYADPVDESTATLPRGWKGRLVELARGDTEGVRGLCLDPHDLAISKYVARREKDLAFVCWLAHRKLVKRKVLLERLEETAVAREMRERIRADIVSHFR
jgi:hypothetical protein